MKIFAFTLTILSSTILWLASLYATILLGWLIFCWQCGAEEGGSIWPFWPLVYFLAIDRIQSAGSGCYGSTNTYTAIYDQQPSDVEFVWTVNGVERPEANGSDELTIQEDYIGGRMYISVVAVSCNGNSIGEPVERIVVPPIANTQLSGPTCVYPGRLTWVVTVNGSMDRIDDVKIFPGDPSNNSVDFYWNGDREIDFLAPTRTGSYTVVVYGFDQCGGTRTMFHRFEVSTRCTSKSTTGWPWKGNKSTPPNQPIVQNESRAKTAKIFPNPATDRIKFVAPQDDEIQELIIYDMNGRTIMQPSPGAGKGSLDIFLDDLKDGVYLLRATGQVGSYTKQFVVKR